MQYCKLLYTSIYLKNLKVTVLLKWYVLHTICICILYICIDIIFHVIIMVHNYSNLPKGFLVTALLENGMPVCDMHAIHVLRLFMHPCIDDYV